MSNLTYFYGIGESVAKKLQEKYNLHGNIIELKKQLKTPEIFDNLAINTQIDLTYEPVRLIPWKFADEMHNKINYLHDKYIFKICGSYIREKPLVGDIDIVLIGNYKEFIKDFNATHYDNIEFQILDPFMTGETRIMSLIKMTIKKHSYFPNNTVFYLKLDIFIANHENYMFMILYATGSSEFNQKMRETAKKHGYLLNNDGIYNRKTNEKINIKTEQEVFKLLDMEYLPPIKR